MIEVTISNDRQRIRTRHDEGPLEFGRVAAKQPKRIIIDDQYVSRDQLRIEQVSEDQLRLDNLGAPVVFTDGTEMARGETTIANLPTRLTAGYTVIDFSLALPHERPAANGLQTISRPLSSMSGNEALGQIPLDGFGDAPTSAQLTEWFERLLSVQRSAAGSTEFYEETAQAIVELVNLDRGYVLLRKNADWEVVAKHLAQDKEGPQYSRTVLSQVVEEKRTFFRGISQQERMDSLAGVEAVVASPIFDGGEITGAVYGARDIQGNGQAYGIRPLEAQMVQLLAGAVSAGLARVRKEEQAARTRVQFEQFFSRELVNELERNPSLLSGHDRHITVLFCDLRNFSTISERLSARQTYELLSDVMDRLTDRIMDHDGVIIDYHGDGLAAMWNAPTDNDLHAVQACDAAQAMLAELPSLNDKWEPIVGFPLAIGIGINSGEARVGNAGSSRRLKYGPLGHTVNLASRVEGSTKCFGVPILITQMTREQLTDKSATRRLCQVRVVGIDQPVQLFEYYIDGGNADWLARRDQYQHALDLYEAGQWEDSNRLLTSLLADPKHADDVPSQMLSHKAVSMLKNPGSNFDPVFEMTCK